MAVSGKKPGCAGRGERRWSEPLARGGASPDGVMAGKQLRSMEDRLVPRARFLTAETLEKGLL